ncbi:MAG: hypothetical protein ACLUI3_07720 [Christensenellales bacterium]
MEGGSLVSGNSSIAIPPTPRASSCSRTSRFPRITANTSCAAGNANQRGWGQSGERRGLRLHRYQPEDGRRRDLRQHFQPRSVCDAGSVLPARWSMTSPARATAAAARRT